jgi:hypothetical protein
MTSGGGPNVNGMVNHAFALQNRSGDGDKLVGHYIPSEIAGLIGFDLGLRTYAPANVAIEVVVEVTDVLGNRVMPNMPLKVDGSMWLAPEGTLSAATGAMP